MITQSYFLIFLIISMTIKELMDGKYSKPWC